MKKEESLFPAGQRLECNSTEEELDILKLWLPFHMWILYELQGSLHPGNVVQSSWVTLFLVQCCQYEICL